MDSKFEYQVSGTEHCEGYVTHHFRNQYSKNIKTYACFSDLFLVRIGYLLSKESQLMVKKVGTLGLMIGQGQIKALWRIKSGDQVSQMV